MDDARWNAGHDPPDSFGRRADDGEIPRDALRPHGVQALDFTSLSLSRRTAHERLVRICTVDYEREMVLVAEHEDAQTGEQQIVAVARLNQLSSDQSFTEAEVAALVSDRYQHQGLGTELLRRLVQIARDKKLGRLVAEMLWDNLAIQAVFKNLGFKVRSPGNDASVQAALDL